MPQVEQRQQERHSHRLPVELVYQGVTFGGMIRDISVGGVFVETDVLVPFAAAVQLSFRVGRLAEPILVGGKVRWSERNVGLGIQFDGLRARHVWALMKFLEKASLAPSPRG